MGKCIPTKRKKVDFAIRKFEISEAMKLRKVQLRAVKPFSLMLAPVYVFLKRNGKFVSVKAPLDFFTPEELVKFAVYESLFLSGSIDHTYPFHDAGKRVRAVLTAPPAKLPAAAKGLHAVAMPPAPFELSDAILRIVGSLWAEGAVVEPFFLVAFANGLFPAFAPSTLREARDKDVDRCDYAVLLTSWVCFLALHMGILDLDYLERLKNSVFEQVAFERPVAGDLGEETRELISLAGRALESPRTRVLAGEFFRGAGERVAQKISSRLSRVEGELISKGAPAPTIFGEGGFAGD